jgi:hypothetical protein
MSADFLGRNPDLIQAFVKDLLARHPQEAQELGPVLGDLSAHLMAEYEKDPANNKDLLRLAGEDAAAALAVTPPGQVSALMAAFEPKDVGRIVAALTSKANESGGTDKTPDTILNLALQAHGPLKGEDREAAQEISKAILGNANADALSRMREPLYTLMARSTQAPYDPHNRHEAAAALRDIQQFTRIMTDPTNVDLVGRLSREDREQVFAERANHPGTFPKTPGEVTAFLAPKLILANQREWENWHSQQGLPGQTYKGALQLRYAAEVALSRPNGTQADPALVDSVVGAINAKSGGKDPVKVVPGQIYVFNGKDTYSLPLIQLTLPDGSQPVVALDRNRYVQAFKSMEEWKASIGMDITAQNASPQYGIVVAPPFGGGSTPDVRALTHRI